MTPRGIVAVADAEIREYLRLLRADSNLGVAKEKVILIVGDCSLILMCKSEYLSVGNGDDKAVVS